VISHNSPAKQPVIAPEIGNRQGTWCGEQELAVRTAVLFRVFQANRVEALANGPSGLISGQNTLTRGGDGVLWAKSTKATTLTGHNCADTSKGTGLRGTKSS
jgi:hypothetical protein